MKVYQTLSKICQAITAFLSEELIPLKEALEHYSVYSLVGASGTFEVLENILIGKRQHPNYASIEVDQFYPLYQKIRDTTIEQRIEMEEVPATRVDMIVVALILIDFILQLGAITQIEVSAYAVKEGLLAESLENNF